MTCFGGSRRPHSSRPRLRPRRRSPKRLVAFAELAGDGSGPPPSSCPVKRAKQSPSSRHTARGPSSSAAMRTSATCSPSRNATTASARRSQATAELTTAVWFASFAATPRCQLLGRIARPYPHIQVAGGFLSRFEGTFDAIRSRTRDASKTSGASARGIPVTTAEARRSSPCESAESRGEAGHRRERPGAVRAAFRSTARD